MVTTKQRHLPDELASFNLDEIYAYHILKSTENVLFGTTAMSSFASLNKMELCIGSKDNKNDLM